MRLFDSHCHLHWEEGEHPVEQTLARAREAGVERMLCVGIDRATSLRGLEIAREQGAVLASSGIHPNDLPPEPAAAEAELRRWRGQLEQDGWSAVGETGLDLYWDRVPLETQRLGFRHHLDAAAEAGLPVIIHCREAGAETLAALRELDRPVRGVMHCYSDAAERVEAYLELGLHLSFAGNLTYKKSEALREAAAGVPTDRLLVETDAPFLAPQPKRGKRNEPAFVRYTLETLATVHACSAELMAERTWRNAEALFGAGEPGDEKGGPER